jgi:hypothetical protein
MRMALATLALGVMVVAAPFFAVDGDAQMSKPIALSDSLGATIDATERTAYHLFSEIKDFNSGQVVMLPSGEYRLEYTTGESGVAAQHSQVISSSTLEQLKIHVMFVEKHFDIRDAEFSGKGGESHGLYALALRYASEGNYDRTLEYFDELIRNYPTSPEAAEAQDLYPKADVLWKAKRTQFKIDPVDRSGRTDLLVFSGYYGLWLGFATPIAMEADEPAAFGVGLLVAGPSAVLLAHYLTKTSGISDGDATMIALGGNWGIWQGLGWYYNLSDKDEGHDAIGAGELAGLGGCALGIALASAIDFSPGGAELISAGAGWGAWFGLVAGSLFDFGDNSELTGALVGSDALAVGAGIVAWNSEWSRTRVRLTNLAGVLGTIGGFGVDLIVQPDDAEVVLAIAGAGSIAGLAAGAWLTRNSDNPTDVSLSSERGYDPSQQVSAGYHRGKWSINPTYKLQRDQRSNLIPCLGFQVNF